MNNRKILVSYFIERGQFSKSRHQRSMRSSKDCTKHDIIQIQSRLCALHGKDAKITITKIEDEKDIPNNPFEHPKSP